MMMPLPGYSFLPRWGPSLVLLLLSGLGAALPAAATTYYVDALSGKDTWAGTTGAPSGAPVNNGPWQTLARVAQAAFAPGDSILLHCDKMWREQLVLPAIGTSAAPIALGRYSPTTCVKNPVINGNQPIPDYAWTRQSGNVYQAKYPVNLLRSAGTTAGFSSWSANANHTLVADASCATSTSACVTLTSGTSTTLAISGNFAVEAGNRLNIEYRVRIPLGVTVTAVPRRSTAPYDTIGVTHSITGTGDWQTFIYPSVFTATTTAARIDFIVPPSGRKLNITDMRVSFEGFTPTQMQSASTVLAPAHHPNRGFSTANPTRIFASIGADADRVTTTSGGTASTYLTPGADFVLPPGGTLTPGLGIVVRTNGWLMDEMQIASMQNGNIYFDRQTSYPLDKNWGFYVLGARWMLDSPGEWHFDWNSSLLTVWMPDNLAPASRISLSATYAGLDLSGAAYVTVSGIDVRGFTVGLCLRNGRNLRYSNATLATNGEYGVDAVDCQNCEITNNVITDSGRDAISATTPFGTTTTGLRVVGNRITNSGIAGPIPGALDLPRRSFGAVRAGPDADIEDNIITNSGYIGILASARNTIIGNRVENSCLTLNDCSGVYMSGANNGSIVDHNTVINVVGNLDGMPSYMTTLTSALYLDDLASGVTVSSNVLIGADNGIHLHNAFANLISDNTFYGHRRYQIWAQEGTHKLRAGGDVYDNQINGNRFFPAIPLNSVQHETVFSSTSAFATYSQNRYSTLLLRTVANEQWNTNSAAHDLPEWKTIRGQDLNGTELNNIGYATFSVTGTTQVPNGNLATGKTGWTAWNATAPSGALTVEACPQGTCVHYVAGASPVRAPDGAVAFQAVQPVLPVARLPFGT